ncbi:MAG TPA: PH domain-containing protein [Xanthobacteraceae bacterium]|nr:PH domain-containing protein [Xanthobacteraceae bacterium]
MSYIKHVLQPDEKVVFVGRLSWIVYHRAIVCVIVALVLVALYGVSSNSLASLSLGVAAIFGVLALISAIHAWFIRWSTEIVVTDKRIIYKRGLITRHTAEMNMDKVATVDVDQSIWGRLFDFGSVRIVGAGGSTGIERLDRIGAPIKLRNAIDAR